MYPVVSVTRPPFEIVIAPEPLAATDKVELLLHNDPAPSMVAVPEEPTVFPKSPIVSVTVPPFRMESEPVPL
jgi:hypothetical protein